MDKNPSVARETEMAWARKVARMYDDAIDLGYSPAQAMQRVREKLAEERLAWEIDNATD